MDTKLKSSKSNGIIATLISLLLVAIAALGMCKAYPIIDKNAQNMRFGNYFEEYNFSHDLASISYVLYYNSLNEKAGGTLEPARTLLNIENNVYSNEDEEDYNINNYIDSFNYEFSNWNILINNQVKNLQYYSYDKENNITKTNMNGDIKVVDNNIDLSAMKKDNYQFYMLINFDENGAITISDISGADKQIIENDIKYRLIDITDDYNITNNYGSNYSRITMKNIKNISFLYAVPNNLAYSDSISRGISDEGSYGYEVAGGVAVAIILSVIALAALIFPIKKAREMPLFNGLSKIPFELWTIIVIFTSMLLLVSPRYMIKPALNGDLEYLMGFYINGFSLPKELVWLLNFITWFICFGVIFFAVLILKYIFNLGLKKYFKRRTIIGMIIMFFVICVKKILDSVTKVDLRERNNKLIVKIVVMNAVILFAITSIWFFGIPVIVIYSVILFFVIRKYVDKISEYYSKLREATSKIAKGNLDVKIEEDLGLFEPFKGDLKKIQGGFKKAVEEEVKSQKMKTDLISNVSHDLKTPLTAIITYADLLKDENLSEEKRKQYVETLDRKAQRLQVLIEDLFEMSKASSGNITLNKDDVDVVSLMKQTLLELEDKLQESSLTVRNNFPEGKVILSLDSQRTFRVFENLVINASKYAMPGTRVYVDVIDNEDNVEITMKNMAADEISFNVETIADRFVRGDESRNTEGSGLGLAIAKSFVELQGGNFNISVDGDLFKVTIKFNK